MEKRNSHQAADDHNLTFAIKMQLNIFFPGLIFHYTYTRKLFPEKKILEMEVPHVERGLLGRFEQDSSSI